MIKFCVNLFKWFKTIVYLSNINKKNILSNNITLNNEKIFWDKGYNIIKCSCGTMILARANFKYYKDTYHKPTMTKIVILPHNIPDTNDICPEGINLYSCLNILNK